MPLRHSVNFRIAVPWTIPLGVITYRVMPSSQMRRSSASIAANIAEGCGRGSPAELSRYLQMALGSASELEYHMLLARDLKMLPTTAYELLDPRVTEVKRMLASFIQKLTTES